MKKPGKMLAVLLSSMLKKPATTKYPFKKIEIPDDFRGQIVFHSENCIGCKICVRDCPAAAIAINKPGEEKIFEAVFDLDKCIYCAQCVLSCPKKALSTSKGFELAQLSRANLKVKFNAKPKPPAAPKPAEGSAAAAAKEA